MARSQLLRTGSEGFTLTELLVVLAIMALMATLAPPVLQSARHKIVARSQIYHLVARLQAEHETAIDSETSVSVSIPPKQFVIFFPDGSATQKVIHFGGATISVAPFTGSVDVSF